MRAVRGRVRRGHGQAGRPPGLIRYDSLNGLAGKPRRVLRPRLFFYGAVLAVMGAVGALAGRTVFEATVVRQPGVPWVIDGARIRNQLEVHLTNKTGTAARYRLAVRGPAIAAADVRLGQTDVALPLRRRAESRWSSPSTSRRRPRASPSPWTPETKRAPFAERPIRFVAPPGRRP